MSGHVVLNLLNFRNDFNKFNKTGALILDSIYPMMLKVLWNPEFQHENVKTLSHILVVIVDIIM